MRGELKLRASYIITDSRTALRALMPRLCEWYGAVFESYASHMRAHEETRNARFAPMRCDDARRILRRAHATDIDAAASSRGRERRPRCSATRRWLPRTLFLGRAHTANYIAFISTDFGARLGRRYARSRISTKASRMPKS